MGPLEFGRARWRGMHIVLVRAKSTSKRSRLTWICSTLAAFIWLPMGGGGVYPAWLSTRILIFAARFAARETALPNGRSSGTVAVVRQAAICVSSFTRSRPAYETMTKPFFGRFAKGAAQRAQKSKLRFYDFLTLWSRKLRRADSIACRSHLWISLCVSDEC